MEPELQTGLIPSDQHIRAIVEAASRLAQRERRQGVAAGTAASLERQLHLDWAVQAGQLVLADRAAPGRAATTSSGGRVRWCR